MHRVVAAALAPPTSLSSAFPRRHIITMSMATRRLALNLQQSLRSRAAINSVKTRNSPLLRGLATPVSHGAKTESTTLSNGFTVRCPDAALSLP